jgi:hypothetical protein
MKPAPDVRITVAGTGLSHNTALAFAQASYRIRASDLPAAREAA